MISFQHFHHVKFQLHKQKQIFRHQQNFFSVESEEYAIQERHVTVCDERNTFNNVLEVFFICYQRIANIGLLPKLHPEYQNPVAVRNIQHFHKFFWRKSELWRQNGYIFKASNQIKLFHNYFLAKLYCAIFLFIFRLYLSAYIFCHYSVLFDFVRNIFFHRANFYHFN